MFSKYSLRATAFVAALTLAGVASATTEVTFNPASTNNGTTAALAALPVFKADGAIGALNTTITISDMVGAATFTETGTFLLTSFTNSANVVPIFNPFGTVASGINSSYNIIANLTFSGTGNWISANEYEGGAGSYNISLDAYTSLGVFMHNLGSASLIPSAANDATVKLATAPNGSGKGYAATSLTGLFAFTPAANTTGANGFFQAPSPFNIALSVGNFGGNEFNTSYQLNGDGSVSIFTPGFNPDNGNSIGPTTGNLNFVTPNRVPEPAGLALVGLALAAAGFASRRRKV